MNWLGRTIYAFRNEARQITVLVYTACDGSAVGRFQLPRSLSVECSVRSTDHEPATRLEYAHRGFVHLSPMLLSRAERPAPARAARGQVETLPEREGSPSGSGGLAAREE